MKIKIMILAMFFLQHIARAQSGIYTQPLNDIDGNSITLGSYTGKKILLVVLPVTSQDTTHEQQLLRFQQRYGNTIQVIGLLAQEEGYETSLGTVIKSRYASQVAAGMVLSAPVRVRKSAGAQQAPLLHWLTNRNENQHYEQDAGEAGCKFFVNEAGHLFAAFGAVTSLDGLIANAVATAPLPVNE